MNILNLTIKKKWFDMIKSGQKKEEYREIKDYWAVRLLNFHREMEFQDFDEMLCDMRNPNYRHNGVLGLMEYFDVSFKSFDVIKFRNGYAASSPSIKVCLKNIVIYKGKTEWGAEDGKYYFVMRLGDVL